MKPSNFKIPVQLFAVFFCLGCGLTVFAQSSATLQGTVSDQKGALMPKAKVVVHNQATGLERTAETDDEGNYQVAALPVGVYRLEVQAPGFQTQVVNDFSVEVARTITQNFQLTVGGIEQQVSVVSDAAVI